MQKRTFLSCYCTCRTKPILKDGVYGNIPLNAPKNNVLHFYVKRIFDSIDHSKIQTTVSSLIKLVKMQPLPDR